MKRLMFAAALAALCLLLGCGSGSPSLQSIQVNPQDAHATSPRGQVSYTATGIFSNNASRKLSSNDGWDWLSSNDLVASVQSQTGVANCLAPGTVTITVTAPDDVTPSGGTHGSTRKVVSTTTLVCE